jgi:hypothetical protein
MLISLAKQISNKGKTSGFIENTIISSKIMLLFVGILYFATAFNFKITIGI